MRPLLYRSALLSIVAILAACAPAKPHWTQSGVSDEKTALDWSDCQDYADHIVGYRADDSSSPLALTDRRAAAKRFDRLLESCMRGKGYFPTKGS